MTNAIRVRNKTVDAARGVGILLVVVGHTDKIPQLLFKTIYAFHMPLFFMLSGYLFRERARLQDSLTNSASRLLVPYFIVGLSCAVPSILFGHTRSLGDFWTQLFGTIYSIPRIGNNFYCTPIWFLTCLFCVELIYTVVHRTLRAHITVVVSAIFVGGCVIFLSPIRFYPWNVQIALIGVGFYHIGCIARKFDLLEKKVISFPVFAAAAVLFSGSVFFNDTIVNLAATTLGNPFAFLIGACAGSLLVCKIAQVVNEWPALEFFGTGTIVILGYNYWINALAIGISGEKLPWYGHLLIECILCSLLVYAVKRVDALDRIFSGRAFRSHAKSPVASRSSVKSS